MAKSKSLSKGRPPLLQPAKSMIQPSHSSKLTRTIIRSHHTLHKRLAQARTQNDSVAAAAVEAEIVAQGGIEAYQAASRLGQDARRGGDSSIVLMDWLREFRGWIPKRKGCDLRILEVGSLSDRNVLSLQMAEAFVRRIDLNSSVPGVEQMDFMELPLPAVHTDGYDLISLSLVLNYVPEAIGRGEMLRRTVRHLRSGSSLPSNIENLPFPSLFLVLPLPCVNNSRYLNEDHLATIMQSLGYVLIHAKQSAKLYYSLWRLAEKITTNGNTESFKKKSTLR